MRKLLNKGGWNSFAGKLHVCAILGGLAIGSSFHNFAQRGVTLAHSKIIGSVSFANSVSVQDPTTKPAIAEDKRNVDDPEQMRNTIKQLTTEIDRLRKRVAELERERQFDSIRNRLTKEEQRAENLESQLVGIDEKEAPLQSRMDELNEQLRPENIDHLPIAGSLRPEQVREATRRRLTSEKLRIQSQLELLKQTRIRLQSSLAVTDLIIQRLHADLQSSARP